MNLLQVLQQRWDHAYGELEYRMAQATAAYVANDFLEAIARRFEYRLAVAQLGDADQALTYFVKEWQRDRSN